jgi:hypothetical protein
VKQSDYFELIDGFNALFYHPPLGEKANDKQYIVTRKIIWNYQSTQRQR